ncbi:hypothetical protein EZV62_004913 [Acer yangbiense]|uniref:HMA domain-containing protein n=1 Tax=Acer yangbiense TaxID=1000413 RepID=A0A5C7ILD4_9ROSI|nr:hypothetical protein EZV62_004913 [Acer yangbiense]
MSKNGIGFLDNIQTCILKVHMHCQGCQKKVKKLLRKIEGTISTYSCVYSVQINAEEQVVMVSGSVDSTTLIKKLAKSGKHAEIWSPSSYERLNQGQASFIRGDQNGINGFDRFQTQERFPFSLGNDVQDRWRLENYMNQDMGIEAMSGEIDQNLMGNTYIGEHENRLAMEEENTRSMMVQAGFPGNGADFVGLADHGFGGFQDIYARKPTHVYEHSPPMMIYNHPSTEMTQPMYNMMVNHNYTHQPHIMDYKPPLIPPYKDVGFVSAPYTFY